MFKSPFSFNGRIRRKEFGISFILYFVFVYLIIITASYSRFLPEAKYAIILLVPSFWFYFAQATKRCHDIGKDGWNQFKPFYIWTMLFEDSHWGLNEYGFNPKGIGNDEDEIDQIGKESL